MYIGGESEERRKMTTFSEQNILSAEDLSNKGASRRKGGARKSFSVSKRFSYLLTLSLVVPILLLMMFLASTVFAYSLARSSEEGKEFNILPTEKSFNLLLLGSDTRPEYHNKEWGRTDTIMILHIDPRKREGLLVSIPRDTRVNIEGYGFNKINAAYAFGGPELAISTVEKFTGLDIDNYAVVDFYAFVQIIDRLGGLDLTLDQPLVDGKSGANFSAGTFHINGEQALSFVRSRATPRGDLDRIDRQQYFLKELVAQKFNLDTVLQLPALLNIFAQFGKTDLDLLTISKYAVLAPDFVPKEFETITIPTQPAFIDGVSYLIADEEQVKLFLKERME